MKTSNLRHTHWQIAPNDIDHIQGEDDLHQCIKNILATRKGSDVLRPEFGSNHFDYLDQPFDIAVPNMVREIFIAIERFEKRVVLQQVYISGQAPHFTFNLQWRIAEALSRQIYTTEFSYEN